MANNFIRIEKLEFKARVSDVYLSDRNLFAYNHNNKKNVEEAYNKA